MITKDTAARIAFAYSEIEAGEALLKVLSDAADNREEPDFRDAFGRVRGLQLGVPSGPGAHRLMDVAPVLGAAIIRAHIEQKRSVIAALCEVARVELNNSPK